MEGIHLLENRGYDSAGMAFDGGNELPCDDSTALPTLLVREKGKVDELEKLIKNTNTNSII